MSATARSLYAELQEQALIVAATAPIGAPPGAVVLKQNRGHDSLYLQIRDLDGRTRQHSLGPKDDDATAGLIAQLEGQRRDRDADAARLDALRAAFVAAGGAALPHAPFRVIQAFAMAGLLRPGLPGVLVGTHAFQCLGNMLGVRWLARPCQSATSHCAFVRCQHCMGVLGDQRVSLDPALAGGRVTSASGGRPVEPFQIIGEVLLRLHEDLDRAWTVEAMAAEAGYAPTHFSELFAAFVGHPPMRYLRLLRLERAAFVLERGHGKTRVTDVAFDAGFGSPEAFTRAFKRAFGKAPSQVSKVEATIAPPPWLDPSPRLENVGPFFAWTFDVEGFSVDEIERAFGALVAQKPPTGPFQMGGIAAPWGWARGDMGPSLSCARYLEGPVPPPPPLRAWRLPRVEAAVWRFEGPLSEMATACAWISEAGVAGRGFSRDFAPLLTVVEQLGEHVVGVVIAPIVPVKAPAFAR